MAAGRQSLARTLAVALVLTGVATACPSASAQIFGGGLPGLPGLPGALPPAELGQLPDVNRSRTTPAVPSVRKPPLDLPESPVPTLANAARDLAGAPLADLRRLASDRLLREHADLVEADEHGQPVVRGEVLALNPAPTALKRLRRAGFTIRARKDLAPLGLQTQVIGLPAGLSAVAAIRRLRTLDPTGTYDFDHLYQTAGAIAGPTADASAAPSAAEARTASIGLVDGSAAPGSPALARVRMTQRAFGPGGSRATDHATAVASLLAGAFGRFRGAAPGAALFVADVYGPTPTGGSATALVSGLAWLAERQAPVINISLVGPPNLLLQAAVKALIARGRIVVAAVGNDGPAAPPLYPAAYPGVIAVTGVDARDRVLPEAGRGTHVDFAAPGAEIAAAGAGGGFLSVRGTSFAAPIVAGRLAMLATRGTATQAVEALGRQARDLGAPGPDAVYGRGLVGAELRLDPASVGAAHARLADGP